jgi:hypothetical protein
MPSPPAPLAGWPAPETIPPRIGLWRSIDPDPVSAAIDGYLDFELRWEAFGEAALATDLATSLYFCDLAERRGTVAWLRHGGRWPWRLR